MRVLEGKEVVSERGVVAAQPKEAARIGAGILEAGGNAMDAASATALASCIMRPHATGVGGFVCAAVVLEGKTGRVWSVDSNAVAPAAAQEHMFEVLPMAEGTSINEKEYRCRVRDDANEHGPLAVAVPGMMGGMGIIWERWGKLKWPDLCAPSLALLEEGFPFGPVAGAVKGQATAIRRCEASMAHLMPNGEPPNADDVWHRPDMEKTLAHIAEAGWRDFYEGELGCTIADAIQDAGGIVTQEDMAAFEPRVTPPHEVTFRGARVCGAILPNGSLTGLQVLRMLDCFDPLPDDTAAYWHRYAEVLKLAWRDRLTYIADPDFADVPVDRLLDGDYAMGRTETLRQLPGHVDTTRPPLLEDLSHGTLHLSTADADGNLVAMTISQGGAFGSCFTVPGTGLILGHGMFRLDPRPGKANSIAPGKRPLNNTCPLVVRADDRDIAIGLPGGRRLISVSTRMAQRMIETGCAGLEAVEAPRMHVEAAEPVQVTKSLDAAIADELRQMGHELDVQQGIAGGAHIAEVLKADGRLRGSGNVWAAAPERRQE